MIAVLLALAGVTLLVLLDERRQAAVLAAAVRLDPRARSGMRECRLALPGLVDAVAAALSSGLSVQLALTEVAPTLPRALAPLGGMFFAVMTPEYLAVMFDRGRFLLVVAVALEVVGGLWLWRILRVSSPAADLATLLDAVIVGLEAGLTFELALGALVTRAPMVARLPEARRLLADLALGRGASEAFGAFGSAGPTEARVAALVRAATRFGSPLATLLVTQADALRTSDRRRAEGQARRLPVLMLFPLAVCILPALLCVFLGPPLLSLLA